MKKKSTNSDDFVAKVVIYAVVYAATIVVTFMFIQSWRMAWAETTRYEDYAATQVHPDALVVYENTATEDEKDFFVTTEDDTTLYIQIKKEGDSLSHTETEVTEETKTLSEMKQASIARD